MTIVESIILVLESSNSPLSVEQIYRNLVSKGLYEFKAKDPKSVVRQQIRRHSRGVDFPSARPDKYFVEVSRGKYHLLAKDVEDHFLDSKSSKDKVAEERIGDFHRTHLEEVKSELHERLLNTHPSFFEEVVLDLLVRMGYGTAYSVRRRGKGPDEGIDGEIAQDRLGFDQIYVQAKRYMPGRSVGAGEVRDFVGALQSIKKGVFITTSRFTEPAKKYVLSQQQKQLVLIDGDDLTGLMVEYELGVQSTFNYRTYQVDSDYFGS